MSTQKLYLTISRTRRNARQNKVFPKSLTVIGREGAKVRYPHTNTYDMHVSSVKIQNTRSIDSIGVVNTQQIQFQTCKKPPSCCGKPTGTRYHRMGRCRSNYYRDAFWEALMQTYFRQLYFFFFCC